MGKNIKISDQTHRNLKLIKGENETFTQVINRIQLNRNIFLAKLDKIRREYREALRKKENKLMLGKNIAYKKQEEKTEHKLQILKEFLNHYFSNKVRKEIQNREEQIKKLKNNREEIGENHSEIIELENEILQRIELTMQNSNLSFKPFNVAGTEKRKEKSIIESLKSTLYSYREGKEREGFSLREKISEKPISHHLKAELYKEKEKLGEKWPYIKQDLIENDFRDQWTNTNLKQELEKKLKEENIAESLEEKIKEMEKEEEKYKDYNLKKILDLETTASQILSDTPEDITIEDIAEEFHKWYKGKINREQALDNVKYESNFNPPKELKNKDFDEAKELTEQEDIEKAKKTERKMHNKEIEFQVVDTKDSKWLLIKEKEE